MRIVPLSFTALALLTFLGSGCQSPAPHSSADAYFQENVKPVLESQCLRCHAGKLAPSGLDLSSAATALPGRHPDGRAYIVPGKPDQSLLVTAVARNGSHPKLMPRTPLSLTDDQIGALREWIEDGAFWPTTAAGNLHAVANPENP